MTMMDSIAADASPRRPLPLALADAESFRALFPPACYRRWVIAGSVRRRQAQCGDVDHVVIPAWGEVEIGGGLFPTRERVNLLWSHLDSLVKSGVEVIRHLYTIHRKDGSTSVSPKWGDAQRGVDYRGFKHEIWSADADNWGAQLAIRTGPGPFSKSLVVALQRNGYVNSGGYVEDKKRIACERCGWSGPWGGLWRAEGVQHHDAKWTTGNDVPVLCPNCQHGDRLIAARVPAPEEEAYFRLCGVPWIRPEERR